LHRNGFDTGMNVGTLLPLAERLGHQVPGQLARAGTFPPDRLR
jgi:hydroxymethylglutaryl-CoA lyase